MRHNKMRETLSTQGSGSRRFSAFALAGVLVGVTACAQDGGAGEDGDQEGAAAEAEVQLQPESTGQQIDGFGYSAAFQRAALLEELPEEERDEAVELLTGREGAAPDILRLGIGGHHEDEYDVMQSIQPEDPGGPEAEPEYEWDGWDNGQVWFAQAAQENGVETFYGNAWSAPGYMKDNDSPTDGGTLCGLEGADCDEDWTEAYSDLLVSWADFYAEEGIDIEALAFVNEPDYHPDYESMDLSPEQAAEFTGIFGPAAQDAGYGVVCCESFGWEEAEPYAEELFTDPSAADSLRAFSGHSYASDSGFGLETEDTPVWMSEWASSDEDAGWNEAFDGGEGVVTDGIYMAEHMIDTLVEGEVSAYLWWLGISPGPSAALLQLDEEEETFNVSSRFHVFSAFSRFIDEGAVRYDVDHGIEDLKVAALENPDGEQVIQLLNMGEAPVATDLNLEEVTEALVTDDDHELEAVEDVVSSDGEVTEVEVPARSLVTLIAEG